jgi:hypothetical protein
MTAETNANGNFSSPNKGGVGPARALVFKEIVIRSASPARLGGKNQGAVLPILLASTGWVPELDDYLFSRFSQTPVSG